MHRPLVVQTTTRSGVDVGGVVALGRLAAVRRAGDAAGVVHQRLGCDRRFGRFRGGRRAGSGRGQDAGGLAEQRGGVECVVQRDQDGRIVEAGDHGGAQGANVAAGGADRIHRGLIPEGVATRRRVEGARGNAVDLDVALVVLVQDLVARGRAAVDGILVRGVGRARQFERVDADRPAAVAGVVWQTCFDVAATAAFVHAAAVAGGITGVGFIVHLAVVAGHKRQNPIDAGTVQELDARGGLRARADDAAGDVDVVVAGR